jgi:predicted secreted hydrolase
VGNASYYLSFTRMATRGTLEIRGESFHVEGLSWMDHEWGTTELGPRAEGWDWFSIQLEDGRDVMFYHIRNRDKSVEPLSSGTLVEADGRAIHLTLAQVELKVLETWEGSRPQTIYPARWRLKVPSAQLELEITPRMAAQEMPLSHTYWEGAVRAEGTSNGKGIKGSGYVELTGYGVRSAMRNQHMRAR